MNKLFVFLPCYNEELNIGALIDEWMNESAKLEEEGYYLIVCPIDDKSTDNTQAKMREKATLYGEERINIIAHEQNKNLRGGLNTRYSQNDGIVMLGHIAQEFAVSFKTDNLCTFTVTRCDYTIHR